MNDRAEAVLREALALPREARADVVERLAASLDAVDINDPGVSDDEWRQEIMRRAARALDGESVGEPWAVVRERLHRDVAG